MADWMILEPRRRLWTRATDMRVSCRKAGTEDSEGGVTITKNMKRNKRKPPRLEPQWQEEKGEPLKETNAK